MNRIGRKNSSRQVFWVILAASGMYITLTYRLGGISYEDTMYAVGNLMFFQFDQISPNIRALIFDLLFIGVGGMVFWLAFFGQFVLPVQSLQERGEAVLRLLALLGNDRGPALFIRDGDVIEAADKKGRSAPGVIILDTASAAVLHNKSSYTRAVGPGLVFTGRGESTAGTLDLHTQVRGLGPKDGTENPFAERLKNEKEDDFKARQERRLQTSGLTRDGVEVIPNITAVFRHQSTPGQGNTQFGYNHNAVWRAIAFEAINPDAPSDAESRRVAWDWLPVHMAADLWREYLRKFTLNELFEFTKGQEGMSEDGEPQTVFEFIVSMVNARLKKALIAEMDEVGKFTGRRISSREYRHMRERGLEIISINITNLHLEMSVEQKFVDRWTTTWLQRAKEEKTFIERRQGVEKLRGQLSAQRDFASIVSRPLHERIVPRPGETPNTPTLSQSVELLVRGTLNGIIRDPKQHQKLNEEEGGLVEIIEWLRKNRNDATAKQ